MTANDIATDPLGNGYVIGDFTTTVTFAAGEATETTLTSLAGFRGGDVFVAKYSTTGQFLWARQAGGNAATGGIDSGQGISVDTSGHAYVAGFFSGSSIFGPGEIRQTVLMSSNGLDWDVFVAKYNNDSVMTPLLDLDIADLRTTNRVALSRGGSVSITLVVKNNGTVNGSADATVVGKQGANEVYRVVLSVSDGVGNGRTTISFPNFVPFAAGDISWTATIADQDPDVDVETSVSRIVP